MLKMWLESLNQNILKTPLRVCRVCGLEAWTEGELDLFVKGPRPDNYNRLNKCKKCHAYAEQQRRATDDRYYLKYKFGALKTRCYNPNYKVYHCYGGRGITICDEWLENPDAFVDWALANGFKRGLEIDRTNTDGQYSPDNCRWVTHKEQMLNQRKTTSFPDKGTRICRECKVELPLDAFYKDRYNFLGHGYVCIKCRTK